MSVTRDAKVGIKRGENLRELAGKIGIDTANYPIPVVEYKRIDYWKLHEELRCKEKVNAKEREKLWEVVRQEYFRKHPWHRFIYPKGGYDAAFKKFGYKFSFEQVRRIEIQRHFLWGKGYKGNPWLKPLSRGILLSLTQAQETKGFVRFEIWDSVHATDPILVGFTGWNSYWSSNAREFGRLDDCHATYKICAWE